MTGPVRLVALTCIGLFLAARTAPGGDDAPTSVADLFEVDLEELLNQTVVTATKSPRRLSQTLATVRVITAQQIRERGYQTLSELLADLPGIQFRSIQGFNSYVFMRGAPSQNNLILLLVDGVELNELNSGGFYGGHQFNLANVKRVEIVYGPASALYGTNAASGIINIITRDPEDEDAQGGAVGALAGSFNTGGCSFRTASYDQERRIGYSLSGMYITTDKTDLGGAAGDGNWTEGMQNFERDFSFDGKLKWRDLALGVLFQDKQASRTTNYRTIGTDSHDRDTLWHITFMNLWLRHRHEFTPGLRLQSLAWYRDTTVEDDTIGQIKTATDETPGSREGYYRPNSQLGVEAQVDYSVTPALDLTGGLGWEYDYLSEGFSRTTSESQNEEPDTPGKPTMLGDHLLSAYGQARWALWEDLELTGGVRADHSSVYDDVTTPRCGLVYQKGKLTAKLLYSEAYRAPKPWDYNFGEGNADLAPEETASCEGALAYRFGTRFNAGVAVYRNRIDNLLAYNPDADRWENGGEATTDGVEVTLDYTWRQVVAYANYTFNDAKDDTGEPIDEIARHDANLGVTWNADEQWMFHARAEYIGRRPNPSTVAATNSEWVEDAFVVHGNIGYRWRDWYVNLLVRNVLDETWHHTSNRPPERYRQAERSVSIRAEYEF